MLVRRAQQHRARELLTRLRLHRKQPLEAEHHVTVAEGVAQRLILDMRRTGALVNILRDKIVVQCTARAALTAVAAQAGEQRGFGLVQRGDQLAVRQRQFHHRHLVFVFDIRVKKA